MESSRINPVSLITGAASGIGAACARDIARRSEGGLILVDFDEGALDAVADALENAAPERVSTLAFDVADPDRWAQAASFIKSQYGRLDWALVNAGVPQASTGEATDLVDWRRAPTNLDSALMSLRAVMPLMKSNTQGGSIVVSAAAAAIKAESKAGLLALIRGAAKDGLPDVRVNAIATGGAPSSLTMPSFQDLVRETGSECAAFEKIAGLAMPLARYAGTDGIARVVVTLLSDQAPITGATLVVDGGYTL